jgi:hypothetical protein
MKSPLSVVRIITAAGSPVLPVCAARRADPADASHENQGAPPFVIRAGGAAPQE